MWALDYQFDVTATGRVVKILHVVDEFTRESLADHVDHSIDADATVACLDKIVGQRGRHPEFIRCDNGPELTANALRDWCRFGGAGASYIEPGSPWENPWVESYGSRIRDELLAIEQFDTLLDAQVLVADWRIEYNTYRLPLRSQHAHARRVRGQLEADQPTPPPRSGRRATPATPGQAPRRARRRARPRRRAARNPRPAARRPCGAGSRTPAGTRRRRPPGPRPRGSSHQWRAGRWPGRRAGTPATGGHSPCTATVHRPCCGRRTARTTCGRPLAWPRSPGHRSAQ